MQISFSLKQSPTFLLYFMYLLRSPPFMNSMSMKSRFFDSIKSIIYRIWGWFNFLRIAGSSRKSSRVLADVLCFSTTFAAITFPVDFSCKAMTILKPPFPIIFWNRYLLQSIFSVSSLVSIWMSFPFYLSSWTYWLDFRLEDSLSPSLFIVKRKSLIFFRNLPNLKNFINFYF